MIKQPVTRVTDPMNEDMELLVNCNGNLVTIGIANYNDPNLLVHKLQLSSLQVRDLRDYLNRCLGIPLHPTQLDNIKVMEAMQGQPLNPSEKVNTNV